MINEKTIIAVIPAYNVQHQIRRTIEGLPSFVDKIIVIDDCSVDRTSEEVKKVNDDRITLLQNGVNLGVGGATIEGFKVGLAQRGDIFVKVDGDDQMDTDKMKDLLTPLFSGYDYCKANRFLHSEGLNQMPVTRLVGNFVLTFFTKLASGYWNVFDPQNGYMAVVRGKLELLPFDKFHKRYFFENDMLVHLNILDARVCDVPIGARYADEKSSLKVWKILLSFPTLLVKRFFKRIYKKYVLYDFSVIGFFYIVGLILLLFGSLFGAYGWFKSIWTGLVATTGTVMIAVLPIILGFQLFLQAIVLEVQETKRKV